MQKNFILVRHRPNRTHGDKTFQEAIARDRKTLQDWVKEKHGCEIWPHKNRKPSVNITTPEKVYRIDPNNWHFGWFTIEESYIQIIEKEEEVDDEETSNEETG